MSQADELDKPLTAEEEAELDALRKKPQSSKEDTVRFMMLISRGLIADLNAYRQATEEAIQSGEVTRAEVFKDFQDLMAIKTSPPLAENIPAKAIFKRKEFSDLNIVYKIRLFAAFYKAGIPADNKALSLDWLKVHFSTGDLTVITDKHSIDEITEALQAFKEARQNPLFTNAVKLLPAPSSGYFYQLMGKPSDGLIPGKTYFKDKRGKITDVQTSSWDQSFIYDIVSEHKGQITAFDKIVHYGVLGEWLQGNTDFPLTHLAQCLGLNIKGTRNEAQREDLLKSLRRLAMIRGSFKWNPGGEHPHPAIQEKAILSWSRYAGYKNGKAVEVIRLDTAPLFVDYVHACGGSLDKFTVPLTTFTVLSLRKKYAAEVMLYLRSRILALRAQRQHTVNAMISTKAKRTRKEAGEKLKEAIDKKDSRRLERMEKREKLLLSSVYEAVGCTDHFERLDQMVLDCLQGWIDKGDPLATKYDAKDIKTGVIYLNIAV